MATRSLRFIMLSSTIRTLIGGTPPSSGLWGTEGFRETFVLLCLLLLTLVGWGEETRGGGVVVRVVASAEIGGVGSGGGGGASAACTKDRSISK